MSAARSSLEAHSLAEWVARLPAARRPRAPRANVRAAASAETVAVGILPGEALLLAIRTADRFGGFRGEVPIGELRRGLGHLSAGAFDRALLLAAAAGALELLVSGDKLAGGVRCPCGCGRITDLVRVSA